MAGSVFPLGTLRATGRDRSGNGPPRTDQLPSALAANWQVGTLNETGSSPVTHPTSDLRKRESRRVVGHTTGTIEYPFDMADDDAAYSWATRTVERLLDDLRQDCVDAGELAAEAVDPWDHRRWRRCIDISFSVLGKRILNEIILGARDLERVERWLDQSERKAAEATARADLAGTVTTDALLAGYFDPRGAFVYLLWGTDTARPLYVGMSTNVLARLGSHLGDKKKAPHVERVALVPCIDRADALRREAALICLHQPPWNIAGVTRKAA